VRLPLLSGPCALNLARRFLSFALHFLLTMVCDEGGRNLLLADVVPFLQQAGRKHKCEVQMVEMRWGIIKPKLQNLPKP